MTYALITGASKGIGKAIASQLAARGYNLLLVSRSAADLEVVANELEKQHQIKAFYFSGDLSKTGSALNVFNWVIENNYDVSILVNNAGYGLSGKFETYPLQEHLEMIHINVNTLVELTYLFLPILKKSKEAYILNIASSAAYQAVPYLGLYAATKAFVLQFSRALSYEFAKTSISVTCISPGSTDTNFANRAKVGPKALKAADKVNLTPEAVGKVAVNSMFQKKTEVIVGFITKVGTFFVWLLPKKFVEKTAANLYE